MDPEDRRLLRRTFALAEENNKLAKKMHRAMKWGRAFRMLYWLVIIGISLGAYYFIQPYIDQFRESFTSISTDIKEAGSSIPLLDTIGDFFGGATTTDGGE